MLSRGETANRSAAMGLALALTLAGCGVKRPSASVILGAGFSHKGIVSNCASCHDTGKPFACFPTTGHLAIGTRDCSACHTVISWAQGTFSHSPTPAQCASCHGPSGAMSAMPTSLVNQMDHAYTGLPDCVSCHAGNAGTSWTGGIFSHSPVPSSCQQCHSAQRPVGPVGTPAFDHANGGTGDCVSCHTANIGMTWATAAFSHSPTPTSCAGCHTSQTPNGIINKMAHAHSGLPDCSSCHAGKAGISWAGASFGHSPYPTSCQDCHGPQRPVGPVGSPTFDHAYGGAGDCISCHLQPGVTWKGGYFSHSPAPVSCAICHSVEAPAVLINQMLHSHPGIGDCSGCHTANIGTSWTGGTYSHSPAPASCQDCHSNERPPGHNVGLDCVGCHVPGPSWKN